MNFNCTKRISFCSTFLILYTAHSHAEDPLDQFNWKNVSIPYQRDWMQYVQKLLERILETKRVMPLHLFCVNQKKISEYLKYKPMEDPGFSNGDANPRMEAPTYYFGKVPRMLQCKLIGLLFSGHTTSYRISSRVYKLHVKLLFICIKQSSARVELIPWFPEIHCTKY